MAKLNKVKWGIIGVGDVCEIKSGPALQNTQNSELVAVMRRNGEKAKDFAERHGVPKWYDQAADVINDPDINAIYIATPPGSHEDYTRMAAEAGKPVYVEKPMARNHGECQRMVEVCEKHDVPLYVAFYRRCLPNYVKIKELIDSGAIGDVRHVNLKINKVLEPDIVGAAGQPGNWRIDPEISGGGYFYDLGSHQIDLLDLFFGPIKEASGYARNQAGIYGPEDITVGSFYFENGVVGSGTWCFNSGQSSDEELTTIVGSKGQIEFDYFSGFHVRVSIDSEESQDLSFDIPKHIQQPLIQTIVDELTGKGTCPSTGVSAARSAWVMDQICRNIIP